jgi:AraC-like DNA-binding protein
LASFSEEKGVRRRRPALPASREPRVHAGDLARILNYHVYDRKPSTLEVDVIAARAGLHRRTVYRWLSPEEDTAPLDTADRLLLAVDASLDDVRLIHE